MVNTNELKAAIVRQGKTQSDIARAIGISARSLNSKINNHIPFNTIEIESMIKILDIKEPMHIFFAETVS